MSLRKNFGMFPVALTCLAACTIQLAAQTTPSTCTTAPAAVTNLSIERVLQLSNILTTLTPNVPANILAALTSGAQEIRTRLIYNPIANTVTDTTFLVAPGSPNPTPLGVDINSATIQSYVLNVDKVYTSCKPVPNVLFVGTISPSNGPFGSFTGATGAISIGYTNDNPPAINNVVEVIAGTVVAFSASANGTLTFQAAPVKPPTTSGGAPTVTVQIGGQGSPSLAAGSSTQVFFNPTQLTVTGVDPANLPLTYSWTSDKAINFQPTPNVSNPLLTFQAGKQDYKVTVTVTNSAGSSTSLSFTLTYLGTQ